MLDNQENHLNKYVFFVLILSLCTFSKCLLASVKFAMPIDCEYGKDCYIQNYVDINRSASNQDYKCGFLTYDQHKGTDFRVNDIAELLKGVNVLAAADGIVEAARIDQGDFKFIENKLDEIKGKECGNGIVIKHADGYSSQYCHMLKNSITVKVGDKVTTGQKIGLVGMSGNTEFPHLHITFRKNGNLIEPFTGIIPGNSYNCNDSNQTLNPIWNDETNSKLSYIDTAILNFHSTDKVPNKFLARSGKYKENKLDSNSSKVILWADIMGVKQNDKIKFDINDLDNKNLFTFEKTIDKKYVLYFIYAGKKLEKLNLNKGTYKAKLSVYRDSDEIISKTKNLDVL